MRTLGGGRPPALDDIGAITSESSEHAAASSDANSTRSERAQSAATQGDWDVLVATSGDPTRQVVVERLACSGYVFGAVWLGGFVRETKCRLEGDVYRPFVRAPQTKASSPRPSTSSESPAEHSPPPDADATPAASP